MSIGWNFPSNNYGMVYGIGEAGIETFKGTPYKSLAREICQNSLDAKRTKDKPVLVEFSLTQLDTDKVPGFQILRKAIESCLYFWRKQKNEKTVNFFQKAVGIARQEKIPLLRVSDFNTTGLLGSNQEFNTPWQNLVKASGVSDKDGSSGGSFGIGKSAPFACSDLRTVFYATQDKDGVKATQGIARLVSFALEDMGMGQSEGNLSMGIGYYGKMGQNQAVQECCSLEKGFQREEVGTDVFILGFTEKPEWDTEIIISILEDFLVSIYLGLLEVKVGNTMISKKTLGKVMDQYKDIAAKAYNYYQTLISPEAHVITENYEGLGDVELHILIQNGLHRRVLMSRMNGMKVFDQKNFPSAIQFAGICILKDVPINSYFREMENPQHDAWQPERHKKPTEAKRFRQGLFRFIKEYVLAFGRKTTVAETDAEGVGEYLPDEPVPEAENYKSESLVDAAMDIEVSDLKYHKGVFEVATDGSDLEMEDGEGVPDGEGYGDTGNKDYGTNGGGHMAGGLGFGSNEGNHPGTNGAGGNPYSIGMEGETLSKLKKKFEIHAIAVRLILVDAKNNRYCLFFIPEETSGNGYLQFKLSGEQSNMSVNVSNASNLVTGAVLKTSKNTIYLEHIVAKEKMSVEFNVDYGESSSMEVSLYGYQI